MITGFVTGGFRPFHKGHEALIEYAKSNCDRLIVLVADPPGGEIPYKYRLKWVLSHYLDDPQIEVFGDIVNEPPFSSSDEKSRWWGNYVREKWGKIDRIFSSENYGEEFSRAVGAENWVFNKARSIVPVSGTMIRNNPFRYWDYINNFAKDYFVKKIAIVGTESTGKTMLAQRLAEDYNTIWTPEVGRDIFEHQKSGIEEIKIIGAKHAENISRDVRRANKLLFIDTDINITKSYSEFLFGEVPSFSPWVERANNMDLYIYLKNDAPYFDDGTRLPLEERDKLDRSHMKYFRDKMVIKASFSGGYEKRYKRIRQLLDSFIEDPQQYLKDEFQSGYNLELN